ncbi:hypothetical protein CP533_2167 [Ophiocordyceps camponoti-saundersi (nom. inval.)]|nr:hypothetical protein CP533_2167 [Ophiocordyceps camponoti-saundersi (nom. inval.)]
MAYVAPIHKPTSIRHALRIRFLSSDHDDLVLAKANQLEIWRLSGEGMVLLHTKIIYGTISMMQKLRPKDSDKDVLFIGTDRMQYFNVTWNPNTNQLDTVEQPYDDTTELYMRHSQSQNKCLVDPSGKFMAMHLWEGVLNVFRLPPRKGNGHTSRLVRLDQVRLTELWIKASTFLYSRTGHPMIAFLYKAQLDQEEARIAIYRLTKDDKGDYVSTFDPQKDRELDRVIQDPYASMLVPVPIVEEKRYHVRNSEKARPHLGGVLVVGETLLTYFDTLNYLSVSSPLHEPKIYVAWADYDGVNFFLADDYGRLDVLTIKSTVEPTGVVVTGMNISPLRFQEQNTAQTSRASSLVYMGDNILFLASHHGDSQLLRVDLASGTMVLLKSLSNNAPILDFAIMDMGNREGDSQLGSAYSSGQARIVAGCGAYLDGSLRSIRSGVGLKDEGVLDEIQGIKGLFTLKSYGTQRDDTIILSSIAETRVLRFDAEGGIEEVYNFQGLTLDQETLLVSNISASQVLQITPQSVMLLDAKSGMAMNMWQVPSGSMITAASANHKWVLIAVDGSSLVSLNLLNNLESTMTTASCPDTGQPDQISCLHVAREPQDLGVVGWWSSGTISIVDLGSLRPIHGEPLRQTEDSASVARDLVLVQLHPPDDAGPTLLVAMEDGNVVTFNVSIEPFSLSSRKSVILGSSPARLHILPQEGGVCNVFATTEHSSLIYSAEGRIVYSATTADAATYVAPFNSEAFPDSMVLSTDKHVRLCHVDKQRLTHVKALPMRETVRRVAYSPGLRAFGLGCIKKELVGNEERITSTFKLVDEIIFQELGEPLVLDASASLEMVECVVRAQLPDSSGALAERFVVGTSFISDDTVEEGETKGRILVLGVSEDRQVYQIVSHKLKGACRCLGIMGHDIVAGLSKTVVVFSYTEETTASGRLQKLAAYRPATFPVDLDVAGNMIGVVDLMQSLSLVEYVPPLEGANAKLEERARHYQPAWATSVCHLEDERWLEADAQGNVMVLRRNQPEPGTDSKRLEVTSELNLGEQINRIRRLYVTPTENAVVWPKAFFGSVEGTLYLYGDISPKYQDLLLKFQSRLQDYILAPGNIDFDAWRSFRNHVREGEAPYRFVDGEMVERFLDLNERIQKHVCEGLGPSVEDMRNLVEELRRLH